MMRNINNKHEGNFYSDFMAMKYIEVSSNLLDNKVPESSLLHLCDRFHSLFSWQPSAQEGNIMQIKIPSCIHSWKL